jgi:ABC-type sugar transport system ATPase subunit
VGALLHLKNITKRYPGVVALDDVSLEVEAGEIHALMGENGAGKSTLIKIVSGAIKPEEGSICLSGKTYAAMTPAISNSEGVGVIYQEFNLVPSLSVAENVFLGQKVGGRVFMDFAAMRRGAGDIFRDLGVEINVDSQVGELSFAKQQMVEIAKAVCKEARLLIMDEPSAAIAQAEVENMMRIVLRLREKGVTVIYISHRMEEIFRLADRVTVLRDGRFITTLPMSEVTRKNLIALMVGREMNESFPARAAAPQEVVLEVDRLCGNGDFDISFSLREGEILGIAGLVGAGRTELAKVLFGAARMDSGEIRLNGKPARIRSPRQAIASGIGLIPEDRKDEGGFMDYSILWNISVMSLRRLSNWVFVSREREQKLGRHYGELLRIKTPSYDQLLKNLSGGNQQKVVLAKVLAAQTNIILFDEPTRGIDVGAKQEIYQLMNGLAARGVSIIMITSEMEELIGMSDRILVMRDGRAAGELTREEFDQRRILELASGL